MHIHSIDEGSKMTHVFDIDVGAILNGSIASTNHYAAVCPLEDNQKSNGQQDQG